MARRNIKDIPQYKEFEESKKVTNKLKKWIEVDPVAEKENLKREILKELSSPEINKITLKPKIFISHTEADEEFANALFNLLKGLGLEDKDIFYSSQRNTGVRVSENIVETIKIELINFNTIFFIIHSEAYYKSPICLNEMGAAWILNRKIYSFLTKHFEFSDLRGVISKQCICFKSGSPKSDQILDEILQDIIKIFYLKKLDPNKFEIIKNIFLSKISLLK